MDSLLKKIDLIKSEIDSHRPLAKPTLNSIRDYYRIGLTYTSNALEGNTLTESETKVVIEDGLTIEGKPLRDHIEAIGHGKAYDFLYDTVSMSSWPLGQDLECAKQTTTSCEGRAPDLLFSECSIKKLHALFYSGIDQKEAGNYRTSQVAITGSAYKLAKPEEIDGLMKNFVESFGQNKSGDHPVIHAAKVHKEFVFIHPFIDGNGRVARLLMNLVLMQAGYPITLIPTISRPAYIRSLEKAHTDDCHFITFIAQAVLETSKDFVRLFIE
jgi:Fic family protein